MATSPRFNFSPIYSLSLQRQFSRAERKPRSRVRLSAATRPAANRDPLVPEQTSAVRSFWDYSMVDRLQSPLTRFHE